MRWRCPPRSTLISTARAAGVTAILIIACAVLSATASANTESAASNEPGTVPVSATLTYQVTRDPSGTFVKEVSEVELAITRGGQAYSQPVTSQLPNCSENTCWPQVVSRGLSVELFNGWGPSFQVVRLEPGPESNVVLHLWSGGAHCCHIDQIFSWNPTTSTYSHTERSWGDPRALLVDLQHNGQLEFVSNDDRFAYAFTDYADSGKPLQIWSFRGGVFSDVTRRHPSLIEPLRELWRRFLLSGLPRSGVLVFDGRLAVAAAV